VSKKTPPISSSGPEFRATDQDSRRYQILEDVLSRMGSTQPQEDNLGATWIKKYRLWSRKPSNGRADLLLWTCDTLYPQKLALTLLTNGACSVTCELKATELFVCPEWLWYWAYVAKAVRIWRLQFTAVVPVSRMCGVLSPSLVYIMVLRSSSFFTFNLRVHSERTTSCLTVPNLGTL
jgi:hypothetical protein